MSREGPDRSNNCHRYSNVNNSNTNYSEFRLLSHFPSTIKKATLLALCVIISLTIIQSTNFSAVTRAQAQAQSQTNATYLTYTNFTLGISIQYPSNWTKNQTQNGQIITHFTPSIDGVSLQLGIDNQPKHLDLEHYLQDSINVFQNSSAWKNFQVLRSSSNYTLAGRPAYEIIGTATDNSTGILREIMEAGTFIGPKVYYIQAFVNQNLLPSYAPILSLMKDSLSITEEPVTYATYQNSTNGVSIEYPSNWIKNQTRNGQNFVQFNSPEIDSNGLFELTYNLGIDNQPKSLDLKQYLQNNIRVYQNISSGWKNFHLVQSTSNFTLAARPAYKIIGIATDNSTGILREIIETGTLVGPKVYYQSISTDENVLSYYVPILNRMKDSFSIITPELKQPNNAIYATVVPNNATSNTVSNNLNNNLNRSFITPLNNNTLASNRNSSSNNNFLTYENSSLGLSIQYPSDWTYYHHHIMIGDETDILFYSPPGPQNETVTLAAGNLPFQNASLSDYSDSIFNRTLSISRLLVGPGLQLINSSDTTLGGVTMIPAHKITYSINGSYPLVTLATVGGNKGYFMTYDTNPKFQPTIQKMIDSFKIIQNQQQQQKNRFS